MRTILKSITVVRKLLVRLACTLFPALEASLRAIDWFNAGAPMPAPWAIKMKVLERYMIPGTPWVETGTYLGDTTQFLVERAPQVISLEPAETYWEKAHQRFETNARATILNSSSEDGFLAALALIQSKKVCFWLDGHFSGGSTFYSQANTPIRLELEVISQKIRDGSLSQVAVFVDDVREFASLKRSRASRTAGEGYPPLRALVDWAEELQLDWLVEHDIFVARSKIEQT